jgi:hypothetical protein
VYGYAQTQQKAKHQMKDSNNEMALKNSNPQNHKPNVFSFILVIASDQSNSKVNSQFNSPDLKATFPK